MEPSNNTLSTLAVAILSRKNVPFAYCGRPTVSPRNATYFRYALAFTAFEAFTAAAFASAGADLRNSAVCLADSTTPFSAFVWISIIAAPRLMSAEWAATTKESNDSLKYCFARTYALAFSTGTSSCFF